MPRAADMRRRPGRGVLAIKVGGSLGRGRASSLRRVMCGLATLARRRPVLLVPGGGVFADTVRAAMRRCGIPEAVAHRMALRSMDQFGLQLAALSPAARTVDTEVDGLRIARAGRLPILLVAQRLDRDRSVPRSFRFTSDVIAARVAARLGVEQLVLLKSLPDFPGPLRGRPALRRLARQGVVDPMFARCVPRGCDVWILDGRRAATLGSRLRAIDQERVMTGARRAPRSALRRRASRRP